MNYTKCGRGEEWEGERGGGGCGIVSHDKKRRKSLHDPKKEINKPKPSAQVGLNKSSLLDTN